MGCGKIRQVLPFEEHKIRLIKPSLSGAPDKIIWTQTPSGEYTTKSGYTAILPNHHPQPPVLQGLHNFEWRKNVWNLHTAPKIKLFLWKTFHGAIPVGEQLRARQINVDGKCKTCGQPESIGHLFLHCSFAKQVWSLAPVSPSVEYSGPLDLRTEWPGLCSRKNLPPTGVAVGELAPWIMWQLWKARNSLMFTDKKCTAPEVLSSAIAAAQEWSQSQTSPPSGNGIPQRKPVTQDQVTIVRSDAAWNELRKTAGLGWMIHEENRVLPFSTAMQFIASPLVAEGLALREAVMKCKDLGLPRIRCEANNLQLIKSLTSDFKSAELYGIVEDIKALASSFDVISFVWISREKNLDADKLAKQVLAAELVLMPSPNNV